MNANDDQLVADYLQRLRAAAGSLPADRADELIEAITSHIAEARSAGSASGDSPGVRNVLERLGDPADIVRAASEPSPAQLTAIGRADRLGALEISAVIFLLIGGIVLPVVGWLVGVVLLWNSPRWRTSDKVLGTLVWPGGLLAPVAGIGLVGVFAASSAGCVPSPVRATIGGPAGQRSVHQLAASCSATTGPPAWLFILLAVLLIGAAIAGPIFTAGRLLRRARRSAAEAMADAAMQAV